MNYIAGIKYTEKAQGIHMFYFVSTYNLHLKPI